MPLRMSKSILLKQRFKISLVQEVSLYGWQSDAATKRPRGQDSRHQKDTSHGRILTIATCRWIGYAYGTNTDMPDRKESRKRMQRMIWKKRIRRTRTSL